MANHSEIIWVDEPLAAVLPLTQDFVPVQRWNADLKAFDDVQEVDEQTKLPLWQSECLLKLGYRGQLTPCRVRMASANKPKAGPNPQALMQMMGISKESQGKHGAASIFDPLNGKSASGS